MPGSVAGIFHILAYLIFIKNFYGIGTITISILQMRNQV